MLASRSLFRAPGLRAWEVACDEPCGGVGPEEVVPTLELVLPRRGVFLHHRGRRRTVADPNQALFLRPGEPYRVSHPARGGDLCTVLSVSEERLAEVGRELGRELGPDQLPDVLPTSAAADLLHRRMGTRAGADGLGLEEVLLELLARVLVASRVDEDARSASREPGPRARARHAELVEAACALLASRLSARLDLGSLAAALDTSPYHLSRVFRRGTGFTLQRYHERLRLRAALERLLRGAEDLTELALELGFTDHSHFTNRFRREHGVPPSAVRPGRSRGRATRRAERGRR